MLRIVKRYLLPASLMARLQVLVVLPTLIIISVNAYIFFQRHWHEVQLVMVRSVVREIAHVLNYPAPLSIEWRQLVAESLDLTIDYLQGATLPVQRRITDSTTDTLIAEQINLLINRDFDVDTTQPGKRVYFWIQLDNGILAVEMHRKRVESFTIRLMVGSILFSVMFFILLAALFMRKQVQPIVKLTQRIQEKRSVLSDWESIGGTSVFRYSGASEVRALTEAFADFQHRQMVALRERSEMLHGISHDLRTPLARMKLELALLPQSPEVEALNKDIDMMSHMLESYLDFVQRHNTEEPERVFVSEAMRGLQERWRHKADMMVFPLEHELKEMQRLHVSLFIRPQLFNRALDNLLDNAVNHADRVTVSVVMTAMDVSIIVSDNGIGIPESERELVLSAFYRVDSARRSDGGSGLGLAMVKETVALHDGEIVLDEARQGGLEVTLRFPLAA